MNENDMKEMINSASLGDEVEFNGENWVVIGIEKDTRLVVAGSRKYRVFEGRVNAQMNSGMFPNFSWDDEAIQKMIDNVGAEIYPFTPFKFIGRKKKISHNHFPNGLNCRDCKEHYPYAQPNQSDNQTLICWACRENPLRRYY